MQFNRGFTDYIQIPGKELITSEFIPVTYEEKILEYPDLNIMPLNDELPILSETILENKNNSIINKDNKNNISENFSDPNLKNINFEDLLKQEGINARVTSGHRPGAKTKQGRASNHSLLDEHGHSMAYDVVPTDGDYEKLRKEIYGNPRIVEWLRQRKWGALEETTASVKTKTGASGDHWHFGPDQAALRDSEKNGVSYAKLGGIIGIYGIK